MRQLCVLLVSALGCVLLNVPSGAGGTSSHEARSELAFVPAFTYSVTIADGTDANNSDIVVARRDGSGATTLIGGDTDDYEPSWSLTGDRIAFVRRVACNDSPGPCAALPDDVWVANQDGSGARAVTQFRQDLGNTYAYSLAWSPDGSMIAHCRGTPRNSSVWISQVDRRGSRRLWSGECLRVAWAPDARHIAVLNAKAIVLFTPAGRRIRVLHGGRAVWWSSDSSRLRAVWSPDSTRLAFTAAVGLYTVGADGRARRKPLAGPGWMILDWSGKEMILARNRTVYSRASASGRLTKLFEVGKNAWGFTWRP